MAMRMSVLFGRTLREDPAEADSDNHRLLLRAGLIQPLMAGVYSFLPLALRALRRIEAIIREEMDRAGAQELLMPALQPLELWQESGRDQAYGPVLFRVRDRRDRELVLAPTHEEAITDLVRRIAQSYRDLPQRLYQIQNKFRDEPRPRGGLVRVRQFTMKDAYSFDIDEAAFQASYDAFKVAYTAIFRRCGVPAVPVQADSGAVGGKQSEEFVFLSPIGEDSIAVCERADYAANVERAEFQRGPADTAALLPLETVQTPGVTSIEALAQFLGVAPRQTAKAVFYLADGQPVFVVVRGDLEVNEIKLMNTLGVRAVRPMTDAEVVAQGWVAGYASPVGVTGARVVADLSIPAARNLVAGANTAHAHLRNVNYGRDWTADTVADLALAHDGAPCPRCNGALGLQRGIELGHVFRLDTTYTEKMAATVLDAQGTPRAPIMGCYGIGLERLLAAVVEANHDEAGICWPPAVAPYPVHLVAIGMDKPTVREAVAALEMELEAAGVAVLTDDRDERAGVKFNDADLLGMPVRLTVSPRTLEAGVVELKARGAAEAVRVTRAEVRTAVQSALAERTAPL